MADQNALRGQYKLARVVRANTDSKGIVRDVLVRNFPQLSCPHQEDKRQRKTDHENQEAQTSNPSNNPT